MISLCRFQEHSCFADMVRVINGYVCARKESALLIRIAVYGVFD